MKKLLIALTLALAAGYARADMIGGTTGAPPLPPFVGFPDAPSAAQAVAASSTTQCRDVYVPGPASMTGIRFLVGVQSGSMAVALRSSTGVTLSSSTEQTVPAPGAQTLSFVTPYSVGQGWYKLCLAADNGTATFGKSSGNGIIGCNNFAADLPIAASVTVPGTATANCFAIAGILSGGIAQ